MLELASVIEQGDLSPKSCSVEGSFPLLRGLWLFAPKETKGMSGWCSSHVLTCFSKQADSLVCFVEIKDVDFALLCFATSHGAHSGVMCRLCNDNLVIALVDMHNLISFGCHRRSRDQSSNKRVERQRGPTWRA